MGNAPENKGISITEIGEMLRQAREKKGVTIEGYYQKGKEAIISYYDRYKPFDQAKVVDTEKSSLLEHLARRRRRHRLNLFKLRCRRKIRVVEMN